LRQRVDEALFLRLVEHMHVTCLSSSDESFTGETTLTENRIIICPFGKEACLDGLTPLCPHAQQGAPHGKSRSRGMADHDGCGARSSK